MQRLDLDFIAAKRASAWVGRVLLALAVGVSFDVTFSCWTANRDVKKFESQLAKLGPRALQAAARPASADELAAARDTVQRLSLPWAKLFAAIESAASDQVALLAIEPDPRAGTVKITGDSKDYLAALTYVLNLSKAEGLSGVQLVRHESKANDPQRTVAFTISASWIGGRS
jgi:Tfp pilus assembly protein PilN